MSIKSPEKKVPLELDVIGLAERSVDIYLSKEIEEREDFREHALRTARLVRSVAGGLMPKEVIAATLLHDIADRLHNKNSNKNNPKREAAAREALGEFFTDPQLDYGLGEYISCLLADMVKVESDSGEHRIEMATKAKTCNGDDILPEAVKMISEQYNGKVPKDVWRRVEPLLEFDPMRRFMKDVNLESLVVKACELVDNMKYPSSKRESAWLQDVLEAESYYAPMMEVLGLDGLASMLRGEAHILRLKGQQRHDSIDEARRMNADIEAAGIRNIVASVIGGKALVHSAVYGLTQGQDDYPVHVGEFAVEHSSGRLIAGNYRLKTDGSLANKHSHKYEGEMPMDVLGLTVISGDIKSSAYDFADFVAERLPHFEARPARNKEKAVYVQGDREYIEQVKYALRLVGVDHDICEFKEDRSELIEIRGYKEYQVSKVTMIAEKDGVGVPTEVQFVTKEERARARLREVSHLIYKYLGSLEKFEEEKSGGELSCDQRLQLERKKAKRNRPIIASAMETLEDCHERKANMRSDNLMVNRRSVPRGEALVMDILS